MRRRAGTQSSTPPGALLSAQSTSGVRVYRSTRLRSDKLRRIRAPAGASILGLNAICPYYTMFPLEFPLKRLARAKAGEWVLDPFCGRGTTIFAARLLGLGSVGIDSNPIAAAIAAAKLSSATAYAVVGLAWRILREGRAPTRVPDAPFWRLCFHPETLRDICAVREHLLRSGQTDEEVALRAIVLGILHGPMQKGPPTYLSNQMPRTYATKPGAAIRFWRKHGLVHPPAVDMLDAVARRAHHTLVSDLPPARGEVHLGDARRVHRLLPSGRRFSWVITSPPYFGMRTYRPDQWLRNWFVGGGEVVDYHQEGQIPHHSEQFVDELAAVWRAVARRCLPGARLVVRFGYLPSIPIDARDLLRASFSRAEAGWRISRWMDAGSSNNGRRQSEQFGRCTQAAAREIDAFARLEG
jgi:hypothetical protein